MNHKAFLVSCLLLAISSTTLAAVSASQAPAPTHDRHCENDAALLDDFLLSKARGASLGDAWVYRDQEATAKVGEERAKKLLSFAYHREALRGSTPYPRFTWSGASFGVTNGYATYEQSVVQQYRAWCSTGKEDKVLR